MVAFENRQFLGLALLRRHRFNWGHIDPDLLAIRIDQLIGDAET